MGIIVMASLLRCASGSASNGREDASGTARAEDVIPAATQQLLDALPHDRSVWERYLSERAVYVSEAGDVVGKEELLEGFAPFPEGLSGSIVVKTVRLETHGDVAVHIFDAHERQTVYEQQIEVDYRSTHTWRREKGEWRLIAAHNLVLARDPVAAVPVRTSLDEYVGTYELSGRRRYRVERRGELLAGGREGSELKTLIAVGENVFVEAGDKLAILRIFLRGPGGSVDRMLQRRKFAYTVWLRIAP